RALRRRCGRSEEARSQTRSRRATRRTRDSKRLARDCRTFSCGPFSPRFHAKRRPVRPGRATCGSLRAGALLEAEYSGQAPDAFPEDRAGSAFPRMNPTEIGLESGLAGFPWTSSSLKGWKSVPILGFRKTNGETPSG